MTDPAAEPPQQPRVLTRALMRAAERAAAAASGPLITPAPAMPVQPLVTIAVVALAGLLTITTFAGPLLVALAVGLAAGIISWGWSGLLGLPSPRGTAFVLAVGSVAAVGTVSATVDDPFLSWMPAALAGSMIVAFVQQLARRDGRPRLVESIASNVTAIAIVVSGASYVALARTAHGGWVVALASTAVAVSALTDLAGGSQRLRDWLLPLAMLAGGVAAIVVGLILGVSWGAAALLGGLAAGVSHAVRRVLAMLPPIGSARSQLVSACASVLTGGVVVYVLGRLLIA